MTADQLMEWVGHARAAWGRLLLEQGNRPDPRRERTMRLLARIERRMGQRLLARGLKMAHVDFDYRKKGRIA